MQKFPGQGLNLCHSSDPSHNSDNIRSFNFEAAWELILPNFFYLLPTHGYNFTQIEKN